jgi:3-deoxy-D-manno-octulosonate 8-phosphate phosphatase (KDO 8-P phosphatase)
MDVDGVLTDGTFIWGPNGEEFKRFSFLDIMGISLAKKQGFIFALISGENSPLVDRFAEKMGIEDVYKGCKDKAAALRDFMSVYDLQPYEVCFMGDDVNDIPAMEIAGMAAAPVNATGAVREMAHFISNKHGGDGAVRELLEHLMGARSLALEAEALWAS